jgi:hypothetical protein
VDIERELAQHHIAVLRAIDTKRVELAIRRMKAYVKFAEAFLDATAKRGITFSTDAAKSVSFMDWRTPSQIISYAYQGIIASVKSGDRELIAAGAFIPIQFMKMSIEKNDFLFYRKISQIYPAMLSTAYASDTILNKELIIDKSWRYLREFSNYILPELIRKHDHKMGGQYISQLVWFFGDLMKIAMDHSDTNTFATIGNEMNSLFRYLEIHKLEEKVTEELKGMVAQEREIIWFGLGAWIMRSFILTGRKRDPGQPNPNLVDFGQIQNFLELIARNFSSIKQLAKTYERALTQEYKSRIWLGWLMETLSEGEVHSVDFKGWLTHFYVVCGLRLSKNGKLLTGDIPETYRELEFRMKEVREKIDAIKSDKKKWETLIPWMQEKPIADKEIADSRWDYFISANETAIKEWTRLHENEIIASKIDQQKIVKFKEQCLEGFEASAWVVKVISDKGIGINETAMKEDSYRAVHERIPKEAFIESNDIPYVGLGFNQGATIGRDINQIILSLIETNAEEIQINETKILINELEKITQSVTTLNNSALIILAKGNIDMEKQLLGCTGFTARWIQSKPRFNFSEYLGDMNNIPTFFQYNEKINQSLSIDLSRVGKLIWHIPQEHNFKGLAIKISEIDEKTAIKLVEENPKFMQDNNGTKLTRELAIRNLTLDVDVFVGVKIELEVSDYNAIKKIRVV